MQLKFLRKLQLPSHTDPLVYCTTCFKPIASSGCLEPEREPEFGSEYSLLNAKSK